eukprot:8031513-Heterocapsa_arctica.AAC.1
MDTKMEGFMHEIKQLEAEASLVPRPLTDALGLADLPKELLDMEKGKEFMQTINEAMQALAKQAKPIQEAMLAAAKAATEVQPPNAALLRQPHKPRAPATKRKGQGEIASTKRTPATRTTRRTGCQKPMTPWRSKQHRARPW